MLGQRPRPTKEQLDAVIDALKKGVRPDILQPGDGGYVAPIPSQLPTKLGDSQRCPTCGQPVSTSSSGFSPMDDK